MDVDQLTIAPADLAVLDDPKADAITVSDRLQALTGERPTLQIDITDAGVIITARCAGIEVTGATADDATKALGPETVAVVQAATLQRDAMPMTTATVIP